MLLARCAPPQRRRAFGPVCTFEKCKTTNSICLLAGSQSDRLVGPTRKMVPPCRHGRAALELQTSEQQPLPSQPGQTAQAHAWQAIPKPTQLLVEGMLMKLLAQSPDGTLMCCANETHLKLVESRFPAVSVKTSKTPGAIMAASFHPPCTPQKYEIFLKIDSRTLVAKPPDPAPFSR